jgi:hypothetical protein
MNWWERITNKLAVKAKADKGEKLNRKETRLIKAKESYKRASLSPVANPRTLNPYAVQLAKDWRNKYGIDNKSSNRQRQEANKKSRADLANSGR